MSASMTFADLIVLIKADPALSDSRRRHVVSDLQCFLRETGRQAAAVPATVAATRELIQAMRQRPLGVEPKRWSNIRASVNFALSRHCGVPEQHWEAGRELQGAWRELRDRISHDLGLSASLSRLFRYCALHGIAPDQVAAATFAEFCTWLERQTTVIDPVGRLRRTCLAWNQAAATVSGWPAVRAPIDAPRTRKYATPEALPASFRAEVENWRQLLAGDDLFAANAPRRSLRPASIEHMTDTVVRFASGMIHQGVPAAELQSMADLFTREHFTLGLQFQLDRHGGKPSPGITQMTDVLLGAARKLELVDASGLKHLKRALRKVECRQSGLTTTNRLRLAQFDDPAQIAQLLDLPDKLLGLAYDRPGVDQDGALLMQMAVAILILIFTGIRLRNLDACHLERNIIRAGSGKRQPVRFLFERHEVKSHRVIDKPIPPMLAQMLDLYIGRFRPSLIGAHDHGWLFPGRGEKPKAKEVLGRQIKKTIREHTGLVVNVHLFRHLNALLSDLDDPGNIERIRIQLDHESSDTTRKFYAGFATDRAARRYHEQVLGRMADGKGQPRR